MTKYIVDVKIKANLRAFIEHDSEAKAIKSVLTEMFSTIPDELGDFVIELSDIGEVIATESEEQD
jgi:uncharacterized protein YeeX (DUF496 family)